MSVDPRASIDPNASLGSNVAVGPWSLIGPDVEIGDGTRIASHVVIRGPTRIGANNHIFQFSTIGEDTPALAYQGEATSLEIGDNNVFREGVTIHRGTIQDEGRTVIGNDGLFMAYVHIGHDCMVADHVVMANNASISGHVIVGEYANFGGYSGVAQYRQVGAYSHIAAMSLVLKDVPAYMTVLGNPGGAVGLNVEGMRRRGYSAELIDQLKQAHRIVYRQGKTVKEACAEIEPLARRVPEINLFLESVQNARYGIIRQRDR